MPECGDHAGISREASRHLLLFRCLKRTQSRHGGGRVRDVQKERADERGDQTKQGQPVQPAGEAARQVLHQPDIPGAEEAAEIAERVDPRDAPAAAVPVRNIGGIAQNGPLEP